MGRERAREETAIAVIGASGAGLFAAWRLAAAGRPVVVYAGQGEPRWASRTLIVTDMLQRHWPGFPEPLLRHPITAFELWAGGTCLRLPLRRPDWVVERAEILAGLAALAQGAGATIRWGWRFVGWEDGALWVRSPQGDSERIYPAALLAADGVRSQVGAAWGLPPPPRVLVLQARVVLPRWASPERAVVWFDPEATPYFYWLIPESPREGVLGLAAEPGQPIRVLLDGFLARLGLEPLGYQGGVVAAYRPGLPFRVERAGLSLFRIGDAGGQVKVTTVGGTVTGLWGAAAAVAALQGEGMGLARRLEGELLAHWMVRRLLHRFALEDYERLLWGLNRGARGILGSIPRDRFAVGAWRLLLAQPNLIVWTLRALLRG